MTAFSVSAPKGPRKPRRVVTLSPDAFADEWTHKPRGEVAIGLRLLSEADVQAARAEAARQACGWYEDPEHGCVDEASRLDAFNDGLIRHAVARAACDPNDVTQPYFELAEDTVRVALTSDGARRLWDELVLLHASTGVNVAQADDGDLARLAGILERGAAIHALPPGEAAEVRKLLGYCLERLGAVDVADEAEEDVAVYRVSSSSPSISAV